MMQNDAQNNNWYSRVIASKKIKNVARMYTMRSKTNKTLDYF